MSLASRGLGPRRVVAALLALAVWIVAPGQARAESWVLTLVEGDAVVIDGTQRVAATAGQRPGPGAIVETSAKTGLLRFESADQVSIDLGPDTRAMIAPPSLAARDGRVPQLYLLQGWAKVTSRSAAQAAGVRTPGLELAPFGGAVVLQVLRREQTLFVENGAVEVIERRAGGVTHRLAEGQVYSGDGMRRGAVAPRPATEWLEKVPRAFRDPVPLRAAAWRDRRAEPEKLPAPTYAQLADWLAAETEVRQGFPQRFGPLARDAEFRRRLVANLAAYPEWNPVLFPPPPPPPPAPR